MDTMQPVLVDIARAGEMGVDLSRLSEEMDRRPAVRPNACPTCADGVLTITHPRRCRECTAEGL